MRSLSTQLVTQITSQAVNPCFLVDLTFTTGQYHVWSGVGSVTWNGNTYLGVGSLGQVGDITEGTQVRADGTTLTLSGIDSTLLDDCLSDIQVGAPATVWFGVLDGNGNILATNILFAGTVDKPTIHTAPSTVSITLALENQLYNLQRACLRRYTSADQRLYYPQDIGFSWVEIQNDIALVWGS
jgi:hypothetical protein